MTELCCAIIIEIERENDGRWIADIPSVPGAMAYGDSRLEAISKALTIRDRAMLENLAQPDPPSLYLWSCINCRKRVQSRRDLHVNDRLICCECNAEMKPDPPSEALQESKRTDFMSAEEFSRAWQGSNSSNPRILMFKFAEAYAAARDSHFGCSGSQRGLNSPKGDPAEAGDGLSLPEPLIDDSAEEVAATAYQIFGVMGAPVRVLDYFAAIAHGKRPENILPFSPDEVGNSAKQTAQP